MYTVYIVLYYVYYTVYTNTVYTILCIKNTNFAPHYTVYITVYYTLYTILCIYHTVYNILPTMCVSIYPLHPHSDGRGVLCFINQIIRLIDGNAKLWKSNL